MGSYRANILTIGNELLNGSVLNSNGRFLGEELTALGFKVISQRSCRDRIYEIEQVLQEALSETDLIVLTGGLGPTPDDVTREGVASFFKTSLRFSPQQYKKIAAFYKKRGKKIPAVVRREACFPAISHPIINRFGIALGFYIKTHDKMIVVLPGVPGELEKMFIESVIPILSKHFKGLRRAHHLIVKAVGLSEPEVVQKLGQRFLEKEEDLGIYPQSGQISLRFPCRSVNHQAQVMARVRSKIGKHVFSYCDEDLEEVIGKLLLQKKWTLATAESCSGGLVASLITNIVGASQYFKGAVVAYDNQVKKHMLQVPEHVLKRHGAVSRQTALYMARGVMQALGTSVGLSITGVAGPGGGTQNKPVGTVAMAICSEKKKQTFLFHFMGRRVYIQRRAAKKALELLWYFLRSSK